MVPISAKHNDLGKFGSQKAFEYQAFLTFVRGIIRISHRRISLGFPEDAKSEIESSYADASPSDHTSLASESHFDMPGNILALVDVVYQLTIWCRARKKVRQAAEERLG